MTYTYQRILDPYNNMIGYISLEHTCDWMSYYKHHTDIDDPHYIQDDAPSDYLCQCTLYYTYHSIM